MAEPLRRSLRPLTRTAMAAAAAVILSGCGLADSWFGSADDPPLPGERISVMRAAQGLQADPAAAQDPISIPAQVANAEWPQAGLGPTHQTGNLALSYPFSQAWRSDIGAGGGGNRRLVNPPIVAAGRLFVVDGQGRITALNVSTGQRLWSVRAASPDEDSVPIGGGLAYSGGILYATTAFGEVLALDPGNGGMIWRTRVAGPVRGAPVVADGRVYAVSVDNQLHALDTSTGALLWRHQGLLETASILRAASPAVSGGVVVVPYSSGEIYGLRVESGTPVWADSLAAIARVGGADMLADISASPVIDGSLVVATSNAGRTVGIDMRTGLRAWEQAVGSTSMPAVAGNSVFLASTAGEVVALSRVNGAVHWVTELPRFRRPEDRTGPILWSGPILAGGRLVLVSSFGKGVVLDARTGAVEAQFDLPTATFVPPIVADGTLFVLTDNGDVVAYR